MQIGRLLILIGFGLVLIGAGVLAIAKLNLPLGRLPGDFIWRGKNGAFYFPWVTCLLLSLVVSLIMWLFNRR
jgi:hypothetical protein